jgi:4-hydroxy-tetrahydrodipicolinate synthase
MGYKTDWFRGIFPALVTPFTQEDRIDEDAYRALIRRVLPHVNGIVPVGTTGEFSYMTESERLRAIEIVVDEVGSRVPVVAGTGAASTAKAVRLTQQAKDAGAQAALVVAPYYLKPTFNEVYDHFRAINQVGLPIILYNLPQCAGTHFRWWTAEAMLLDFDNVIGIKDTSGDIPFFATLCEKVADKVSLFIGHDEAALAAFALGADGAILASANLVPDVWQRIFAAVQRNDLEHARQDQRRIQSLARIVTRTSGSQAVKEALTAMGLPMGNSRHPIVPCGSFSDTDFDDLRLELERPGVNKIPKKTVTYDLGSKQVSTEVFAISNTPETVVDWCLKAAVVSLGFPASERVQVELLIGLLDGPVGNAIARSSQETCSSEHISRVIHEHPRILLVPATAPTEEIAKSLFEKHVVAGMLNAIEESVSDGFLADDILDDIALIARVGIEPAATMATRVQANVYRATRHAIRRAIEGERIHNG